MFNNSTRERKLLLATCVVLFAYSADYFLFRPLYHVWNDRCDVMRQLTVRISQDQSLLSQKTSLEKLNGSGSSDQRFYKGLSNVTATLQELQMLAGKSGVVINDLRPQRVDGLSNSTQIEISVHAEWGSLIRFIDQIQISPGLIQIGKVTIEKRASDSADLDAQFMINELGV